MCELHLRDLWQKLLHRGESDWSFGRCTLHAVFVLESTIDHLRRVALHMLLCSTERNFQS